MTPQDRLKHMPRHNLQQSAAPVLPDAAQPQTEWSAIQVGDELVEFGRWDATPFIVRVTKVTPKRFATASTTYSKTDGRVVGGYGRAERPTPEHREAFTRHKAERAFAVVVATATNRGGLAHLSIERIHAITEELRAPSASEDAPNV